MRNIPFMERSHRMAQGMGLDIMVKERRVIINAKGYLGLRGTVAGMKVTPTGAVMLVTLDAKQGRPVRTIGFVPWVLTVDKKG